MEGEQPPTKRAKNCDDAESAEKTESNVEPKADSEPVVVEERKRKIPTARVDSPKKSESEDESKPGPSKASSPFVPQSTFLDLDDDCQTKILAEMSLNDLGAMAEVCVKYKEIAQHFFASKHRNFSLSSLVETPGEKFSLSQARRLLYNFGHLITTLTINLDMLNDRNGVGKLLTLISKYCVETLGELIFENQPSSSLTGVGGIGGMTEYIAISMLGMELMMKVKRWENFNSLGEILIDYVFPSPLFSSVLSFVMKGSPPGQYGTRSKTVFRRGESNQIQELHQVNNLADLADIANPPVA